MNHFTFYEKSSNRNNNKCFSFKYFCNFANNNLKYKYSSFKYSYSSICIHNLIFNEKCRIVSRFKEYLIYDDDTDFLRSIYEKEELKNTLKKIVDFYDRYNKVFPNYMILPENIFMYKNLRKKQKMIDEKNRIKMEKAKNDNNKKLNLQEKNDIKVNICFFDEKIKENINRQNNSLLTLSLTNTIISNNINNNENKKNDNNLCDNNSFVESNINNSSINISLYSKRKKHKKNENNNNYALFDDDTLKSESSLENIVDILNSKKYKKIDINNKINNKKVNKLLNIDIISINNNINNNYNKILTNNLKTQDYIIKTPTKNKLLKKEKEFKQQNNNNNHKSLNNNKTLFNHKKNISDFHSFCPYIKNTFGKILTNKKTSKFICKFPKESKNIIEEITSSLIGKYKNNQRNKKKIFDGKNVCNNKKIKNLTLSNDNYEHLNTKASNNSKEKRIKVNNYFTYKRINKHSQNNNIFKYNKIIKNLKNNEEEKNKNEENKIYEIFKEKYKSHFNNEIKEKRKDFNRKIIDTNSTDSTKMSLNNRKSKFLTYDKLNNSNNLLYLNNNLYNSNNEVIPIQSKEEYIFNCNTLNNFNQTNYQNTFINNTESNVKNKYIYTLASNISKNNQKQNKNCIKNQKLHKKHKTFSSQLVNNNFNFINWCSMNEEYKINYLNNKLKKIKEEIIKNRNNYKEIKEKYRKLSENNQKKILSYPQSSCQKIFDKNITCTAFSNNSVEKRQNNKKNSNNNNRHYNMELFSKIKIKTFKKDKNTKLERQRNFSLINNNKKLYKKQIKKEVTKDNILKSKDKILQNKANIKKIKFSKKN